ncbi:MAG: L,D-transpeptidase family protein [Candidatus Cloacimonetes bacterium]|nr:L,D-transpeptidase family protein [Candidatus Cloacimonadota bacterium]
MILASENEVLIPDSFLNLYLAEQNEWTVFIAELTTQKAYLISFSKEPILSQIIREFPISSGKQKGAKRSEWDLRTPEGFYQIIQFRQQHTLEDKFGTGAFILNYPNEIDKILVKTGGGIWIHGTDRNDFINFDSEGCIRLKNEDLTFLTKYLNPGQNPVFIVDKIEWKSETDLIRKKDQIKQRINDWISSQKGQDIFRYLDFYHPTFYSSTLKMDIGRWTIHSRDKMRENRLNDIIIKDMKIIYQNNYLLIQGVEEHTTELNTDSVSKHILWQYIDQQWFIVNEDVIEK